MLSFLTLLVLFICVALGQGQDQRVMQHPLTNMPPGHPEIQTSFYFPEHADKKFPIGENVTVLCQVQNTGDASFNISAIMGSLNFADNFQMYIQVSFPTPPPSLFSVTPFFVLSMSLSMNFASS
jgi:hypothetical protein